MLFIFLAKDLRIKQILLWKNENAHVLMAFFLSLYFMNDSTVKRLNALSLKYLAQSICNIWPLRQRQNGVGEGFYCLPDLIPT